MTEQFKIGEIVEFLGCGYTSLGPCKEVEIVNFNTTGNIQVAFPTGSRYRNGTGAITEITIQNVRKESLKKIKAEELTIKVGDYVNYCGEIHQRAMQNARVLTIHGSATRALIRGENGEREIHVDLKCLKHIPSSDRIQAKIEEWEKEPTSPMSFEIGARVERVGIDFEEDIKVGALGTIQGLGAHGNDIRVMYDGTNRTVTTARTYNKLVATSAQSTKTLLPPFKKEIPTMSLKITTSNKVNGIETNAMTASQQAELIAVQQNRIEILEKVEPKTKKITASIKELKNELAAFVAHLDSLPE